MEGRMLGKATRVQKHLQMLSDITSKDYENTKRGAEDWNRWRVRLSHKSVRWQKTEARPNQGLCDCNGKGQRQGNKSIKRYTMLSLLFKSLYSVEKKLQSIKPYIE